MTNSDEIANDIAIIGMAAHLPGAENIGQYWTNLRDGVRSIVKLSEDDLAEAGENPGKMRHKNYVPYAAKLDGFKRFDGEFFGFSPKESAIMDPQHRQFLEVTWEALENAGHPPENFDGAIGVFAGCGMGSYFYFNVCSNPDLVDSVGMFLLRHTGNDKDFLSTRVSHFLDIKGPSLNLQTACSTSLVATHYACQSLLNGECDMALAGGVTIELPHGRGYVFEDGEILSPDGECHAFDHRAQGTVFGSGAGSVVLRRLEDALADGDHIWGVIKGTAVNNDGAAKAGYLAPSVDGQAAAIAEAQAIAGVTADTVDYIECHGTGTYLGDPIEVAALTSAFRETTDKTGFCKIGSVKTNIGHLDTAAGVASLIKASLALHHKTLPPSLGFEKPNPAIDFENSPFSVNDKLSNWAAGASPRRAGVNSLGVGGTNAHAVLQEAPARAPSDASDWPFHILPISARTRAALDGNAEALKDHLRANQDQPLADVAFTLTQGRRAFEKRRVIVAETHAEAASLLEENNPRKVFNHTALRDPEVAFMFPGGGAQYVGMARDLYETEPVFAQWVDQGLDILQPKLDYDIRALWLPENGAEDAATDALKQPSVQLPLIMIVEYALAQMWMSWGVQPTALVGHSMGENTAACLSGVMSFEDCIGLVHLRGSLFDTVPAGGMLSVPMAVGDLQSLLGDDLDVAAVNAPELTVVSGPQAALDRLQATLAAKDVECQRIPIDIAAHSQMLQSILKPFGDYLRAITLNVPTIPFVSNSTGVFITDAEATDPEYWVNHLRGTVRFADCITTLSQKNDRVYLEVGPGKALSSLCQAHGGVSPNQVLSSLRHPNEQIADDNYFMGVLGRLWAVGVQIDWDQIWGEAKRHRVPLPTYSFQREPYFIEPGSAAPTSVPAFLTRKDDVCDWGYKPVWRPRLADCELDVATEINQSDPQRWLIFSDEAGVGAETAKRLRDGGHSVIEVVTGDAFSCVADDRYVLAPERGREGYDQLIQDVVAKGFVPNRIAHFWLLTQRETFRPGGSFFHRNQEQGFFSLLFLAQAIADENLPKPLHINVITSGAAQVRSEPLPYPEKSTALGPVRVIPRELPGVSCALLDAEVPALAAKRRGTSEWIGKLACRVLEDLLAPPQNSVAALRGDRRYELEFRATDLSEDADGPTYRDGGVYMLTGGFGGIGLTIAEDLIKTCNAKLVLLARSGLPDRADWDSFLRGYGPHNVTSKRIRAVQRLEALDGEVMVATADVCNVEDMRDAIAAAKQRFGGLHGVIHGAGVVDDGPLLAKGSSSVEDVFTPKIHGTQVLHELFPDGDLDWLVLFSSTSTVTAPAGQVDYVAANEYLNAYAKSRKGCKTKVVAINWGIWNEVGMAADAVAERTGDILKAPTVPVNVPLLDEATFDDAGNRVFSARYSVANQWFLDEHRTKAGDALVPGTGYLELAAQALHAQGESGPFELRDFYFLRPLHVEEAETRDVQIRLIRSDEGYRFEVRSGCKVDGRNAFMLNAQARIILSKGIETATINVPVIADRCTGKSGAENPDGHRSPQEEHLNFGPRWRVLNAFAYGDGEGIARLSLPNAARGDLNNGYQLHPALMDLATGWAMGLIEGYEPTHLWVPVSYDRVRVLRPLPAEISSWVRGRDGNRADGSVASFDITICDNDGNVCVEVEGFSIKRLDGVGVFAKAPRPAVNEVEFADGKGAPQPLSEAEERLHHNLSQGILPLEGAEAFRRALSTGLPQIVVSSLDLNALTAQAAASVHDDTSTGQKFQRPELDTEYEAPKNDIERTLVGFWEDLLGVQQVGTGDSFFDLGGHSLIAVRLFSMVKKAYRIEFPISILFEAPTIAKCAALIAERVGGATDSGGEDAPAKQPKSTRRFTHLVAMHDGEGGPKTPFFLVAGMFGNVLNLRHLAHLLGADRRFYGLQARGLYGDVAPHRTLQDAAKDYIAEMRIVQPNGPYLLGGFSGGGITAYEIAQQLKAEGCEIAQLVMLDTPLPVRRPLSRKDRVLIQIAELKRKGPGYLSEWIVTRVKWEIAKRQGGEVEAAPEYQFQNAAIEAAFLEAVAGYEVAPWDGPLTLFRPPQMGQWQVSDGKWVDSQRAYVFPDNDWAQWAPSLEIFEVPGDHDSMVLEPNVRVLAARMKRVIEAAEANLRPASVWPNATAAE